MELIFNKQNISQTQKLAHTIASFSKKKNVIALSGELGSGKTFFTIEFCKSLGIHNSVSSPSYVLMNEYQYDDGVVNHFDLYRLSNPDECLELQIPEIFEDRITIIEWPEIAKDFLPQNTIFIHFEYEGIYRKISINAIGRDSDLDEITEAMLN